MMNITAAASLNEGHATAGLRTSGSSEAMTYTRWSH